MRNFKDYGVLILKGMGMGASDVVPGVSGGTIAFITGIYEELIDSIKSINLDALKSLFSFRIAEFWKKINGFFLLAVFSGILISIFSLANLLEYLLIHHPVYIWSFFFGLVIASAIMILKDIEKWRPRVVITLLVGVGIAFWITTITPAQSSEMYWFIFLSGALAICAMILPGISGSFILLLLGKYQFILNAVSELKIIILLIFTAGAVTGLIAFSNFLSWLLKKFRYATIAMLAGFMIGSLNKIWPWKITIETYIDRHGAEHPLTEKNVLPEVSLDSDFIPAVLIAIAGFVLIFILSGLSKSKKE
jgi:putative membrane protein